MNILTRSIVRHAHAIARESSARAVLLSADVLQDEQDLAGLIEDVAFRVILVTRREGLKVPEGWGEYCQVVRVPDVAMTRAGQIKVAILIGSSQGLIAQGDRIVCVTGLDRSGTIDTVIVLDLGHELEMFGGATADPLPSGVEPAVFQRLLTLASELGPGRTRGAAGRHAVRPRRPRRGARPEPATGHQPVPRVSRGRAKRPRPSARGDDQGVLGDRWRLHCPGGRRPALGGSLPGPGGQARRAAPPGAGYPPRGRRRRHGCHRRDGALCLAVDRHRLDLPPRAD